MKTKSCFGYPWAQISQCQMPDPQTKKKAGMATGRNKGTGNEFVLMIRRDLDASCMSPNSLCKVF